MINTELSKTIDEMRAETRASKRQRRLFWLLAMLVLLIPVAYAAPIVLNNNITTDGTFTSSIASGSNAVAVSTNGGRIDFGAGASDYASSDGTTVTYVGPLAASAVSSTTGKIQATTYLQAGTYVEVGTVMYIDSSGGPRIILDATAPTIASGFGTSPSIISNGTVAMRVTVGTGGTESTGVLTLPAAARGWNCTARDLTNNASFVTDQDKVTDTTTGVSFTNYSRTTGLAIAWTAGDVLSISCWAH